jgi:hypothetical protein
LDTKIILMAFAWIILLYTWWSLYSLQGKIKCQFRRKNRTVIDRTIKMTDKIVKFDGGSYDVNPRRIDIKWFKLWGIFPYPMPFLEWKWDSDQPLDPTTFKNSADSPESLQASDSEKSWRGFNQGVDSQVGGKKSSGLERYLPWIAIGAIVIVGFFVYQLSGKLSTVDYNVKSLFDLLRSMK